MTQVAAAARIHSLTQELPYAAGVTRKKKKKERERKKERKGKKERKERRKEGRKKGRKEGRKEGRKKGRKKERKKETDCNSQSLNHLTMLFNLENDILGYMLLEPKLHFHCFMLEIIPFN